MPTRLTRRADFDRFSAINRFSALDGLRALSVIAVVWHHTSGTPGPAILGKGYQGVDFFFAISGFLITTLLLREQRTTGRISLRKFYARRSLRIFPLYYVTLLLYVVLVAVTLRHSHEGRAFVGHLPAFATYTSNWFVDLTAERSVPFYFAWSLATEEQFYLLWPPLLVATLAIGRRRTWVPLAALIALVTVSQGARLVTDTSRLPGRIPASLSLPILLGAAAALAVSTPRGFAVVSAVLGRTWSAPAAGVLLAAALALNPPRQITQVLMAAVVVSTCLVEWTPLHPMLQWRPLVFVGVLSYGVYLLHMLCANLDRRIIHQQSGIVLTAATLITVIFVAYLSFRFFETPLLTLKRRYETQEQRQGDELSRIGADNRPVITGQCRWRRWRRDFLPPCGSRR
ncbi:acyltransferase [Mycobacterium sp.]|uniref:acyltransferase family protein n=1 Tax=Mycobacterium sp. TaxID=1785 RepID=UPI0025CF0D7F|nr:acyltransferase [Mycobacterium sp.]